MSEQQKKTDDVNDIGNRLSDASLTDDKTDDSPPPKDDKVDICIATTVDLENIGLPPHLATKIVQNKFETFKKIREFILKDGEEQFQKIKDKCRLHPEFEDIFFHSEPLLNIMHKSTPSNCNVIFDKNYSQLPQSEDQLLLLHVNIESLGTNKGKLEAFGQLPDVICLTEVNKNKNVAIEGYECKAYAESSTKDPKKDDATKVHKGGAAIYLKKNSEKFDFLTEESDSHSVMNGKLKPIYECAWVKLKGKTGKLKKKKIAIGAIYRHPQTCLATFHEYLYEMLYELKEKGFLVYVLGDFNIDLLNKEKLKTAKLFTPVFALNLVTNYSFHNPHITPIPAR